MKTIIATGFIILTCAFPNAQSTSLRNTISLADDTKDIIPKEFNHTVRVPGLVSLATPSFKESAPSRDVFFGIGEHLQLQVPRMESKASGG